jgi:dienelactone hydrolase
MTILAADLASHGYIVITIDPPRGSEPAGSDDGVLAAHQPIRLAAVGAALDVAGDPAVARQIGSMDMDRIAVGGHSFGGTVAFDSSLAEQSVRAVFDLDGGLGYIPGEGPVPVPALLISSERGFPNVIRPDPVAVSLLRDSTATTTAGIRGSGHCDLADLPIVYRAAGAQSAPDEAWCFGSIGSDGPTSVALIVRRFLDAALGSSPTRPDAADLIKDVPGGYIDPLGVGH